jgi:hypothetical protein
MLPVMGLRTRELFALNAQDTIAFDTKFSYRFSNTSDQFVPLPSVMPVTWSGTNYDFFYSTNYAGAFWVTNDNPGLNGFVVSGVTPGVGLSTITTTLNNGYTSGQTVTFINLGGITNLNGNSYIITVTGANTFTIPVVATGAFTTGGIALNSQVTGNGTAQDGIRYYAVTGIGTTWVNYNPPVDPNNALAGALGIVPYRGYLVFLNTWEGNDINVFNFGNRARWTQIGTPYYSLPVPTTPNPQGVDINAARDDLFGKGGASDAPTQEIIIGWGFIKDILIVYFERSTWRLRFVNNAQNPFVWERINVELGASATFSAVQFDKGLMAIGERGIVIADSNDTIRFDEKIPDQIFKIRIENEGMERVNGIRTFQTRLIYWTYPDGDNPKGIFPDKVLVLNYDTKNWSFFDDTFTCFGYFYAFNDLTWADLIESWSTYNNLQWNASIAEEDYETIIAGNQQGFVFSLEQTDGANGRSLYITAISGSTFTSPNNNLQNGTWINLSGIAGTTDTTGVTLNGRSFKLVNSSGPAAQPNTFTLQEFTPITAPNAVGSTYTYTLAVPYIPVFPGSVYITVGSLTFTDNGLDGKLLCTDGLSTGTIDYSKGKIILNFNASIGSTVVYIRIVSQNANQGLSNVVTTGTYTGGGYIAKISNIDITSKIFNFLPKDQRSRLHKIDFYCNKTSNGEFTVNVFGDSSNTIINQPLTDNPRQNVVQTSVPPYQVGSGEEIIYRLYTECQAQTVQIQLNLSDAQMAVPAIANSDIEILGMNFSMRPGGRII